MLKFARITGTMDEDGMVTVLLKIPGTFGGIDKSNPAYSSRVIDHVDLFFGAPVAGDY